MPVTGLRIQLRAATVVKGRIDLSVFGNKKPDWAWVSAHRLADNDPPDANGSWASGFGIDAGTGNFSTEELSQGRFRFRLHAQLSDKDNAEYPLDVLVVPAGGLSDVVMRPGPRVAH